nr:natural killer cell receptor 2B4-like [Misgurnus anguillicaudatus]
MNWFKNILFICHFFLSGDFVSDEMKPDEVKSVSVTEGDSVTLHTGITGIKRDDLILWMFVSQETRIAQIYMKDIWYMKEIFGDRLKLDSETGSLTITNIRITHTGLYKLQIFRKTETKFKRFSVIVYAPLSDPVITRKSSSGSSSNSKCVLLCSVLNGRDLSLSWYKGNSLLSIISVSDLNIRLSLPLEVEYQDTNTYSCVVSNPIKHHTQHLDHQKCSGLSLSELKHPLVVVIVLLVWLIL